VKVLLWMALVALCLPAPMAAQAPASPSSYSSASSRSSSRVIQCGTDSRRRVLCAAGGEVASAKLVRELSSSRCGPAGSWGWTSDALWADNGCRGEFSVNYRSASDSAATRRISCGTVTSRRDECSARGVVDSVRLMKQSFFSRCREGSNWGHGDTLIWAGNGCRGEFEVKYRRAAPAPQPKPVIRTISCGRTNGELHTCTIDGYVDTVRLVRERSENTCRQKLNWDYARTFVWAKSGCRGVFEVTYRDSLPTTGTRRLTCGSGSAIQVQCSTEGQVSRVTVVRNLGTGECREGDNWRHSGTEIVAGNGCRAEFEVTYGRDTTPGMRPVTPPSRVISCGNASGSAMSCNAFGTVATVRLQRDRSGTGRCGTSGS
jgi:hypothetical protein